MSIATKDDIKKGAVLWCNQDGRVREVILISEAYGQAYTGNRFKKVDAFDMDKNKIVTLYLGDLGVPGFLYDERPCQLFKNRHYAEICKDNFSKWLIEHKGY